MVACVWCPNQNWVLALRKVASAAINNPGEDGGRGSIWGEAHHTSMLILLAVGTKDFDSNGGIGDARVILKTLQVGSAIKNRVNYHPGRLLSRIPDLILTGVKHVNLSIVVHVGKCHSPTAVT